MTTRATEFSTPPMELQVGVPSGQGKATFPSRFRPYSPIIAQGEYSLMVVTSTCCVMRQAPVVMAHGFELSISTERVCVNLKEVSR